MKNYLGLACAVVAVGCLWSCSQDKKAENTAQEPDSNGYIVSSYSDAHKILYDDAVPRGGAAGSERGCDVINSPHFRSYDFYKMKSNHRLTLLEGFRTYQQCTEVTCGPSCALMVLEYFGKRDGRNETVLAALRGTGRDTTNLRQLLNIFDAIGGFRYESNYSFNYTGVQDMPQDIFLRYLQRGIPVIVGSNYWGGHWQVVIGVDNMGTPDNPFDDILILADPYDTVDHNQDGYITYPFQRLFYDWSNRYDPDYKWGLFVAVWPE